MLTSLLLSDPLSALEGFVPFILAAFGLLMLAYLGLVYLAFQAFRRGSTVGTWALWLLVVAGALLLFYLLKPSNNEPGLFNR